MLPCPKTPWRPLDREAGTVQGQTEADEDASKDMRLGQGSMEAPASTVADVTLIRVDDEYNSHELLTTPVMAR